MSTRLARVGRGRAVSEKT